ncbi:MAG: hypothetical protein CMO80_24695 [Verrucomicrobiales bacterium]|nr:hypothetical protein [Verrucomicrobiales bacterium]
MVHYPGTGLPKKYAGHFFLCHFKGNIANSKIQAFSVKPNGASFKLDNSAEFAGNMQPTDLEFEPDGIVNIEKTDITERRQGLSGMPVGLHMMLGKRASRSGGAPGESEGIVHRQRTAMRPVGPSQPCDALNGICYRDAWISGCPKCSEVRSEE